MGHVKLHDLGADANPHTPKMVLNNPTNIL